MSGAADFFTHKDMRGDNDLYEGKVPVERIGYTTEMLTKRAVEYISQRRQSTNPFYLSLHYTAPHWPWEGPNDEAVSRGLGRGYDGFTAGGSLRTYAQMMTSMDEGIGEVLRALERTGQADNTLVIFTSDNGGERFSYNWPFRGQKFTLWEGGIRVPAIVRLPGAMSKERSKSAIANRQSAIPSGLPPLLSVPGAIADGSPAMSNFQRPRSNVGAFESGSTDGVRSVPSAVADGSQVTSSHFAESNMPIGNPSGRVIQDVAITMDWTATILAAAGAKPDPNYPLDGIDLMPIIRGTQFPAPSTDHASPAPRNSKLETRNLFWRTSLQDAALRGRWKYVRDGEQEYLFDLLVDEREQANFREQNPGVVTQLRDAIKKWDASVLPRPAPRRRS
jgi:arylsulfatase A-like enzyme